MELKDRIFISGLLGSVGLIYLSIFSSVLALAGKIGWTFPAATLLVSIVLSTIVMTIAYLGGDRRRTRDREVPRWRQKR